MVTKQQTAYLPPAQIAHLPLAQTPHQAVVKTAQQQQQHDATVVAIAPARHAVCVMGRASKLHPNPFCSACLPAMVPAINTTRLGFALHIQASRSNALHAFAERIRLTLCVVL